MKLMKLDKLPSVITNNEFNEDGLVKTRNGLMIPAYVGSGLGFNFPGKYFLNHYFYPALESIGVFPLCPFKACAEYLDFSDINENTSNHELLNFWDEFNKNVVNVNYGALMPKSKFMIALMEGPSVDDGLASEVAYYHVKHGKVVGIRSDVRPGENRAATTNPAVDCFIDKKLYFTGDDAYVDAHEGIKLLTDKIREG